MSAPTPSYSDLTKALRLDGAPLLFILCSLFAILSVASAAARQTPTATIAAVATWFGAPETTMTGAMSATHEWFVSPDRVIILSAGTLLFAVAIGWQYISGWKEMWRSLSETQADAQRAWSLRGSDQPEEEAQAELTRATSWAYHLSVQGWWYGILPRLAALTWVCTALSLELGWWALIGLAAVTVATFVADAVFAHSPPSFGDAAFDSWLLVKLMVRMLVALPWYLGVVLFNPGREPEATPAAGS